MLNPTFRNQRNQNYHRLPSLKVRTPEGAAKFVEEVGFCLLFPDKHHDLPNLMEAVHGGPHPGLMEWSDEVENDLPPQEVLRRSDGS